MRGSDYNDSPRNLMKMRKTGYQEHEKLVGSKVPVGQTIIGIRILKKIS